MESGRPFCSVDPLLQRNHGNPLRAYGGPEVGAARRVDGLRHPRLASRHVQALREGLREHTVEIVGDALLGEVRRFIQLRAVDADAVRITGRGFRIATAELSDARLAALLLTGLGRSGLHDSRHARDESVTPVAVPEALNPDRAVRKLLG